MELILEEIAKRKSGRAYDHDRPVSDEMIRSIIEAGRLAPSCANTQAWDFVVIRDPAIREKADEALTGGNYWAKRAPVMIFVVTHPKDGCSVHGLNYFMMDVGLAVENMLIQAVHLGLMGHPTAGWNEDKLKEIAGIPHDHKIATVVFFGYEYQGEPTFLSDKHQAIEREGSQRKEVSEVLHWNHW